MTRHVNDSVNNQKVFKTVPFDSGDKVRTFESKSKFDKGKKKSVRRYIVLKKGRI